MANEASISGRQKISRDDLLQRSARLFKRHGYHGTSMDMLASACGLNKATLYHHYTSKEALALDVLTWTHGQIAAALFALAFDTQLGRLERMERMNRGARRLFDDGIVGCLMGVVAADAAYGSDPLTAAIRRFFDDWAAALDFLFAEVMSAADAQAAAHQTVADFEGALLLARVYGDLAYWDRAARRAEALLSA